MLAGYGLPLVSSGGRSESVGRLLCKWILYGIPHLIATSRYGIRSIAPTISLSSS